MAAEANDIAFFLNDDDEDEEMEEPGPLRRGRGANGNRLPLQQFLRLIAGGRLVDPGGAAATNEQLLQNLRRGGVIQSEAVNRAMRICARNLFVPEAYREEAFVDAPIRVEEHDFNVSAPHMHCTMLEALNLQPGHAFLDVGSGCGVLTACGALLVGKQGTAVGLDVRRACVQMGREAVRSLASINEEYSSTACPARFELGNVFMPPPRLLGAWDRVHVGASCPPERLQILLQLLRPEGGLIVVPVAPNDLRLITKRPNGSIVQRVLSQVRFSELEVPTDAELLLSKLRLERRRRTAPPRMPSTFVQDVAAITASLSATSPTAQDACNFLSSSPSGVIDGLPTTPTESQRSASGSWPHRLSRLLTSCASGISSSSQTSWREENHGSELGAPFDDSDAGEGSSIADASMLTPPVSPLVCRLSPAELGEPDCLLVGTGWQLPVHWTVLCQRCEYFCSHAAWSGRSQASVGHEPRPKRCMVPDHFNREGMEALLHYAYTDQVDRSMDPQEAVALLHIAQFYGCTHLAHLCEVLLGRLLKSGNNGKAPDQEVLADAAAALLALADDHGLAHLRTVALDYCINHWDAVSCSESFASLSRSQVEQIAAEASASYQRVLAQVRELHEAQAQLLPDPSY